jgi:uncharacterized protein YdeI (YjbR/CyaY-like superfamily)
VELLVQERSDFRDRDEPTYYRYRAASRKQWKKRFERLIAEGRMRPAGLAEIERAKADGRWDAAYRQKDSPVPAELQTALDASPAASAFFATLTAQNRWAFIFRVAQGKKPETRERNARRFAEMMERGETFS